MTRYRDTCKLVSVSYEPDDEGVLQETRTERQVFCNSYTVTAGRWATAKLADYNADAEIQLRTCDYAGETDVLYQPDFLSEEKPYSVKGTPQVFGDFTRLMLEERTGDRIA